MGKDIKALSLDFLICCYFGQSKDLIRAAIDRAYVDMASHTLKGFSDNNEKWARRKKASELIRDSIENYEIRDGFKTWHENTIDKIEKIYETPKLMRGQSQKWLNMTIKYLFVLKTLIGTDDKRFESIKTFINNTNTGDYLPPIDSYVLSSIEIKKAWSKLNETDYDNVLKQFGEGKDFLWELEMWEQLSKDFKNPDSSSYAYYLEHNT